MSEFGVFAKSTLYLHINNNKNTYYERRITHPLFSDGKVLWLKSDGYTSLERIKDKRLIKILENKITTLNK